MAPSSIPFSSISAQIFYLGSFPPGQEQAIRTEIERAYNGSTIVQSMFYDWVIRDKQKIFINYEQNKFEAEKIQGIDGYKHTGKLTVDVSTLINVGYIDWQGKAKPYTLVQALTHELSHALTNRLDDENYFTDYLGTNASFTNLIWQQLNFTPMLSRPSTGYLDRQSINYSYIRDSNTRILAPIDDAIKVDNLGPQGLQTLDWTPLLDSNTRDLLLGGSRNNTLKSGAGNDFLFGGGGDDTLDGGDGIDTAVYFGRKDDYNIFENFVPNSNPVIWDGTWTVQQKMLGVTNSVTGEVIYSGTDRLKNIEFLQFDDIKYDLVKARQKRIAIVLDATGSAGSRIRDLQNPLTALVEAGYADNNDTSVAVVLFKDSINGEPSVVAQSFTAQNNLENFADRKFATTSLLDSIIDKSGYGYGGNEAYFTTTPGDVFGGGGDAPETSFDGLQLALTGAGEWTVGEGTRQIFLFTDAPAKDGALASYVTELAHNIGATVQSSSAVPLAGSSVNTFNLAFGNSSSVARLAGVNEPTVNPNLTNTQVQIFTIFTGGSGTDTSALEAIARDNGGAFLAGLNDNDLLTKLVEIVNNPFINQSPMVSIVANDPDATETIDGNPTNSGQFTLNRTGNLSQSLTVAYTLSGAATNGSDYQSLLETVTFAAGDSTATIDLTLLDDRLYEGSEAVTLTLSDGGTQYSLDPTAQFATVTITDNDTQPTISIDKIGHIEGNSGTNNYAFNVTLSNPSVEIFDDRPLMNPLFRAGFKSLSIKSNARQLSTVN